MREFRIADRRVADGEPCFIIAEAGVNHNGDLSTACRLVEAAKRVGADAIKFQSFDPASIVTATAPLADYQAQTSSGIRSQLELLTSLALSPEKQAELISFCRSEGVLFLSTPFDRKSADSLVRSGVPCLKVSSGDLTNLPFLRYLARLGLPLILSTGMASLGDTEEALEVIEAESGIPIALLHCVSCYPADAADANLRALDVLKMAFDLVVGYSDHSEGNEVALASVALGARIVEKHLTLDRKMSGPDHRASSEPEAFADLVRGIRKIESALGSGRKRPTKSESNVAEVARRSLVALVDIPAGTILNHDLIDCRRPGSGLPARLLPFLLGKIAARDLKAGTLLRVEDFK